MVPYLVRHMARFVGTISVYRSRKNSVNHPVGYRVIVVPSQFCQRMEIVTTDKLIQSVNAGVYRTLGSVRARVCCTLVSVTGEVYCTLVSLAPESTVLWDQ